MCEDYDFFIGARIKLLREIQGVSREKFAFVLNLSVDEIIAFEEGDKSVHPFYLQKLAIHFGISFSFFLEGLLKEKSKGSPLVLSVMPQEADLLKNYNALSPVEQAKIFRVIQEKAFYKTVDGWKKVLKRRGLSQC